ncbi:hypothetical protein FSST1_006781 [Fusarium sambucinum]
MDGELGRRTPSSMPSAHSRQSKQRDAGEQEQEDDERVGEVLQTSTANSGFNEGPLHFNLIELETLQQTHTNSIFPEESRRTISQASTSNKRNDGAGHSAGAYPRLPETDFLKTRSQSGGNRQKSLFRGNKDNRGGEPRQDGRLHITPHDAADTSHLLNALNTTLDEEHSINDRHEILNSSTIIDPGSKKRHKKLAIVIMIVGSRGDVQPFLKIGKILKEEHGHRVRIATHPVFRDLVERDTGLEFFSVGGDPSELMAFIVKNPNLFPSFKAIMAGDIGRRRDAMAQMFDGFWRSCVEAWDGERLSGFREPFVAIVIIANPPSIMHIHCAEALGIPLHIMFTFPYTPTQAFPHPFTHISNAVPADGYMNFISYPFVETVVWQGLGDLVNELRVNKLQLNPVSTLWAIGATHRMHVPYTYLWSPGLIAKPKDWGNEIEVAGFAFHERPLTFQPSDELVSFLASGEQPIYIGFGSIVLDEPDTFTRMIFNAIKETGVKALISKGWGGLGLNNEQVPDHIFMLGDTPHDWLFPQVKACIHHGGAGTTAIGLKCGKPTMIVPFFGDQHFWGKIVSEAGVGPPPIPYKDLDEHHLSAGIKYCLSETAQLAAIEIAARITEEGEGADNAVDHFFRKLNPIACTSMQCSIFQDRVAVWQVKRTKIKLSALAATILVDHGLLTWKQLRSHRYIEWNDFEGPSEPLGGTASSLLRSVGYTFRDIGRIPYRLANVRRQSRVKCQSETMKDDNQGGNRGGNGLAASSVSGLSKPQNGTNDDITIRGRTSWYLSEFNRGAKGAATSMAKEPMDLVMALAQGFHNAPLLYGDDTVRQPLAITGFHSGLRAGGLELVYGIYDGFTGIIALPIRRAEVEGLVGFAKGAGMGILGLFLKSSSAVLSPLAFTFKGIAMETEKSSSIRTQVGKIHIEQGQAQHSVLSEIVRRDLTQQVFHAWLILKELSDFVADLKHRRIFRDHDNQALIATGIIFENVGIAQRSLAALKRGDTIRSVLHVK